MYLCSIKCDLRGAVVVLGWKAVVTGAACMCTNILISYLIYIIIYIPVFLAQVDFNVKNTPSPMLFTAPHTSIFRLILEEGGETELCME